MFKKKNKIAAQQRLPLVLVASIFSTGLLLSACNSNNDNVDSSGNNDTTTANDTDSTPKVVITENSTTSESDADNGAESEPNTVTDNSNEISTTDANTVSKDISPIAAAAKKPSLLTNPTKTGSAEDTVRLALDTLFYGDAKKAATYYQVDMENFEEELKNTQSTFQQTVESVTIIETKYNKEKTRATVIGELKLKNQSEPAPLSYILQKIDGQWKIMG